MYMFMQGGTRMTNETRKRIHLIYSILVSLSAIVAGICFIVSARGIYQAGLAANTQPYTVETIAAAFSRIAIPVYLCLALVVGGIILNIILPPEKKKLAPEKNLPLILQRLQEKTDLSACEEGMRLAIEKQPRARKLHSLITCLLLVAASALFLSYACNGDNWAPVDQAAEINNCMIRAVFAMAICLIFPFGYGVFTSFFIRSSYNKEIALMKQANAIAPRKAEKLPAQPAKETAVVIARYAIFALALGLIVFGAATGGTIDVLAKAAAICTECVGLG